jgi:radical SAM protein with 4Fe4S-binding SPASM domain
MGFKDFFKNFFDFKKKTPLKPQLLHKRIDTPSGNYRLHLRVEPEGNSILIINASRIIHLNQTATEYARHILEETPENEIIKDIKNRYRVGKSRIKDDLEKIYNMIDTLTHTDDVCPITFLDTERIEPFSMPISVPYRMDLALTYRCNVNCEHCYVERPKDTPEIETEKWKEIISKLYDIGIPHIVFTGGEATLREDLPELIDYAEELGVVTGLLTNGRRLKDRDLVEQMNLAGLDHYQITLESHIKEIHDRMVNAEGAFEDTVEGIKNALETPIYTITNTTLTTLNSPYIEDTVSFLADLGLEVIASNGMIRTGGGKDYEYSIPEDELKEILQRMMLRIEEEGLRFIWYTPTMYCKFNPLDLHLGIKQCTAGRFNMCIEPNGDVLPCQSYYESVGNILTDDWETIWNHPTLEGIRNREFIMEECKTCDLLDLCGGGCPLALKGDETVFCMDGASNPA